MSRFPPPPGGGAALVTGAAQGIGLALATALAAEGWRVVLADLNGAAARARAAELTGARGVTLDVRDADAVEDLVAAIEQDEPLRLLCNNAGVAAGAGDGGVWSVQEWQHVVGVNLMGVVHGINAAFPRMRARRSGVVLNTASLAGLTPGPAMQPYGATKHAVVGLSLDLRVDAAPYGVRVSALCPGWVDTPMLDGAGPDKASIREELEKFGVGAPVPAAEVAWAALDGLRRNRALIVHPRGARVGWWAQRLAPWYIERRTARITETLALQTPPAVR